MVTSSFDAADRGSEILGCGKQIDQSSAQAGSTTLVGDAHSQTRKTHILHIVRYGMAFILFCIFLGLQPKNLKFAVTFIFLRFSFQVFGLFWYFMVFFRVFFSGLFRYLWCFYR